MAMDTRKIDTRIIIITCNTTVIITTLLMIDPIREQSLSLSVTEHEIK